MLSDTVLEWAVDIITLPKLGLKPTEWNVTQAHSSVVIDLQILEKPLETVRDSVQELLNAGFDKAHELRQSEKYQQRVDAYYAEISNEEKDRTAELSFLNEYLDIGSSDFLMLINSLIKKFNLKHKGIDYTRFSSDEITELERLYEFLKTEDGRQLLHEGIIDVMDIKSELLSTEDIEKLKTLQFNSFRGDVLDLVEKVRRTASFTDSVEKSWKSVDGYVSYVRNILIRRYEGEITTLDKSIETLKNLMKRKEYSILYSGGEIPGDNKTTFEISRMQKKMRLNELYTERAKDNPTKVTIVVRK